ncbi:MAG: T9SS type A sorting domain-containing protein [Saprospiraceae bacterium]|nr:T9SS type A sorting domain-containing protein [Saprospiraceae bacterium]
MNFSIRGAEGLLESLFNDLLHIAFANQLESGRALFDIGKQFGGGWSDAVPFCCEDACQEVTVEVLAMDYWCNWSKCWTTVKVEDKTPPEVVCELFDATVSCSAYKTYYEPAVELALAGDFDSLQSVLGRYDKVKKDQYGAVAEKTSYTIYDLKCDSSKVTKDTLVYDEHLGYIWKTYTYYRAKYDLKKYERFNGQIADNCGLVCIEEKPWVNLDHCGNGFIKRVFKFVGQCTDEASGHFADTITRYQTIWVTNDCDITKAMFEVPKDTIIYSCGIEYDPDGSGNVAGLLSPESTGDAKYVFDNDCRLVGIGYYDKVFKIVGGDEACYKIIRTWCFADWCGLDKPIEKAWWQNPKYAGKYLTCVQKIIVYDSQPPICTIDEIPGEIEAAGCYYNLNTSVTLEDECGLLSYSWRLINTKTEATIASAYGELDSNPSGSIEINVEDLGQGSYKLKVTVTDECQNESVCDASFVITANKKPTPVCITSLTADLTPMDSDGDGAIDTAMAVVWASEFNVSSQAACGSSDDKLAFRIDFAVGDPVLPASSATSLTLGCKDQGTQEVRLYVIDESGSWDYCTVLLVVQNNAQGCGAVAHATGLLTGEILTEEGIEIELVDVMVEGNSGVALWEVDKVKGSYELDVTMGVEAFVRPQKDTDPLNGVSTSDLVAIQKDILGKASLDSWYKLQAADANNDGKVSAIDLIQLRKLILGMIDHLPSSDSWRFFEKESNKSFYHIDQMLESMKADFIGVKVGDVNGSNDPSLKAGRSGSAMTLLVSQFIEGNRITFLPSKQETIAGIQFTLEFDASQLKIVDVLPGTKLNLNREHLNLTHQANGWVTLSWNPADGNAMIIGEDDALFTLIVEQTGQVDLSETMTISSKVTRAEAYDQGGLEYPLNLNFVNGSIAHGFELLQNRPNPWSHETAIGFSVSESTQTILTVYDVSGRMVKQMTGVAHKGYQEWSIDARDMPHSGVYYYKLETNDGTAVRKMILMD